MLRLSPKISSSWCVMFICFLVCSNLVGETSFLFLATCDRSWCLLKSCFSYFSCCYEQNNSKKQGFILGHNLWVQYIIEGSLGGRFFREIASQSESTQPREMIADAQLVFSPLSSPESKLREWYRHFYDRTSHINYPNQDNPSQAWPQAALIRISPERHHKGLSPRDSSFYQVENQY